MFHPRHEAKDIMAELPQKATLPDEYRHHDWTYSWQTTGGFSKRGNSLDDLNKAISRHGFIRAFKELSNDELVIDIDAHDEQGNGWESLKRLEAELGFTLAEYSTHVVDSPRNGRHFYFRKNPELVLPKKIKRFPGIDFLTSSPGREPQLVGLPGSLHPESENRYQCVSGFGYLLTDCPDALIELLTIKEPATTTLASIPPTMANAATTRASKYVATMDPSISGSGGHDAAFAVACALVKGFDLSIEQARTIFVSEYNPRCEPPWSDKEIEHKLKSAAESSREAGYLLNALLGTDGLPQAKTHITGILSQGQRQLSSGGEIQEPKKFTTPAADILDDLFVRVVTGQMPKLLQLGDALDGIEIGGGLVTVLGAPPGAGKTTLAMQVAFESMQFQPELRVTIANAETGLDVLMRKELSRRASISQKKLRFGDLDDIEKQILERAVTDLKPIVSRMESLDEPCVLIQLERLLDQEPGLLILDYLQKYAPPGETKAGITSVMQVLRRFARAGWAVLALSATARTVAKGGSGHDSSKLNQASFRDSSEIEFNSDAAYILCDKEPEGSRNAIRHTELVCFKNRFGEKESRKLTFDMPKACFEFSTVDDFACWPNVNPFASEDESE